MPVAVENVPTPPILPKWQRPAKTTADLPWANLKVLDISRFDQPGGKEALAEELREAVHTTGFFALTNTGFAPDEVQRQYDIGQSFFNLPPEEKGLEKYRVDFGRGNYFGYKPPFEKTVYDTEVLDNVESLNVPKFIPANEGEPFHPHLNVAKAEIEAFSRKALALGSKVFRLFALILELPEDYFSSRHEYEDASEDHLRYMTYHPRSKEDDAKVDGCWSRAHTDFGSLTLLWSQDIAGLQIKTDSGEWKYVPPVDNGIICNVGDTLQFWSAGYLKSTVHRVIRPPEDQAHLYRQGLFYFVRPGNQVDIAPAQSPLLERLGLVKKEEGEKKVVTGLEYVRARVKNYHDAPSYNKRQGKTFKVGDLEIEDEAS
ncbi:2OG-Fe(II) oxygenase superfamily protein [Cutaneotrichosporon oleaginosum]|uniref:2OG-Fe(II) oxygenase superfamily protein n=1 Tax=Cutaneotrichosporon oleaginosum TaxID=879819 RepID=A0A0J0XZV7_9TREE|nr:2OG-Fe(II) oxygenase superfamily protein [Cutaneotrichosporon oleaginosum]KLT46580.1 2OG-Fe(II) oxygenase superfamily protein [Cutaneotrichosporon oleaginosum]TXT15055.1 hypothetical protein COLE_01248 [Cutaneotrichosporon oleaginosum]